MPAEGVLLLSSSLVAGVWREACGVTASGAGGEDSRRDVEAPLEVGLEGVEASAGRNWTRIFFSWMEDLLVCSTCDHCSSMSVASSSHESRSEVYQGLGVVDLLTGGDADCLHEELVAAFGVGWWIFFHGLQEHCVSPALASCHSLQLNC